MLNHDRLKLVDFGCSMKIQRDYKIDEVNTAPEHYYDYLYIKL